MRKLATAAAVSLALASGGAKALILGEIEMRSALNQPIDAEIELTSVAPGELDGMRVQLASPEAFARAGIERSRVLTDLRFNVTENASGQPIIQISSRTPILEPFLNFLLDVEWQGGRLVREYTVLLDPPVFMSPTTTARNTAGDTPATVTIESEDSVLTPLPIDRTAVSAASDEFDATSVTTVGDVVEIADEQVSSVDVDVGGVAIDFGSEEFGEVVEFGSLDEVGNSANSQFDEGSVVVVPGSDVETGVVTLTDPSVENPVLTEISQEIAFDEETGWEVQVLGDATEISDEVGSPLDTFESVALATQNGATITDDNFASADINVGSPTGTAVAGSEILVQKNDTLWEIAEQNSYNGVSTQQMMIALLEANQQAFINGNINLVKAGAVLRIPEQSNVNAITQTQALAEVSSQERLWREYRDQLRGVRSDRTAIADAGSDSSAPSNTEAAESSALATAATDVAANTTTSEAAQKILDQAREELRAQLEADTTAKNELNIVADTEATSTVASATADESTNPDTDKLGSINRKLQLAREELAAARLESAELTEQSSELDSVTTNMDQLVNLQQDKLAKLQNQLKEAQERERLALEQTDNPALADSGVAESESVIAQVENTVSDGIANVREGVADATNQVGDQINSTVNELAAADAEAVELDLTDNAQSTNTDSTVSASIDNTLAAQTEPAPIQSAVPDAPWYQKVMNKQGLAIGGLGLLAAGGLFAVLRRRRTDENDPLLDQVEFVNEDGNVVAPPDNDIDNLAADMTGETVALDASTQAEVAAPMQREAQADHQAQENQIKADLDADMDAFADSTASDDGNGLDDDPSLDDTISEAEVYLAYGLHGQAEDLLTKAIKQNPTNTDYHTKLLQTYHAQGNQSAFEKGAAEYYKEFGGNNSPDWEVIRGLGQDMNPANELFIADSSNIESLGKGSFDAPKLDSDDFEDSDSSDDTPQVTSQVREFGDSDEQMSAGESSLMDQSLDPGFAFDENDLEASGDFSSVVEELKQEEAANESSAQPAAASEEQGVIEFDAPDVTKLDATQADVSKITEESIADDLSLDLNRLSDDIELDSTELMEGELDTNQALEMPDLTSNADLTGDGSESFGDVDEMDTMMDLAKAYIDMGDNDSASSALGEIVKSGNPEQKTEAENLLRKIS